MLQHFPGFSICYGKNLMLRYNLNYRSSKFRQVASFFLYAFRKKKIIFKMSKIIRFKVCFLSFFVLLLWTPESSGYVDEVSLISELKNILFQHQIRASKIGCGRVGNETDVSNLDPIRIRRDMPSIHMKKGKKKLRTCANMNGILGISLKTPCE